MMGTFNIQLAKQKISRPIPFVQIRPILAAFVK